MSWNNTLTIASGISSGISGLCFLATLYFRNASRKEERSIAEVIDNTGLQLKPSDVIEILKQFDGDTRLDALEKLLNLQREKAEMLMEKLKSNINLEEVVKHQDQGKYKMLMAMSAPATVLFLIMFGWGFSGWGPPLGSGGQHTPQTGPTQQYATHYSFDMPIVFRNVTPDGQKNAIICPILFKPGSTVLVKLDTKVKVDEAGAIWICVRVKLGDETVIDPPDHDNPASPGVKGSGKGQLYIPIWGNNPPGDDNPQPLAFTNTMTVPQNGIVEVDFFVDRAEVKPGVQKTLSATEGRLTVDSIQ